MAPTFNTQTGEPCPCLSEKPTGALSFLLHMVGVLVLAGVGSLLVNSMLTPTPALPPTAPVTVSPSPTTAVPFSPTPDPWAPTPTPLVMLVIEITRTPVPTPTLTPPEATIQAAQATATAIAAPITCERTVVKPGESKTCFWAAVLPSPTVIPTLPPCETPIPLMRCEKKG